MLLYCPHSFWPEILQYLRCLPKIKITCIDELSELRERIESIGSDCAIDLTWFGDNLGNDEIYDALVIIQSIDDQLSKNFKITFYGINFPSKPNNNYRPLNKIHCIPIHEEAYDIDTVANAYEAATEQYKSIVGLS